MLSIQTIEALLSRLLGISPSSPILYFLGLSITSQDHLIKKRQVVQVENVLKRNINAGCTVLPYHAGIEANRRQENLSVRSKSCAANTLDHMPMLLICQGDPGFLKIMTGNHCGLYCRHF